MGLFDGVPAPTYVEPGEDRRRAGLFGLQMAEPFIQAYQKGLDRGESSRQFDLGLQEKRRQFDLEGALREAQIARDNAVIASEKAQLDMYKLKAQEVELGLNREKNFQKQANEALAFEQSLGGDYGQAGWQQYLEFAKRDPDIRFTEWGQSMEKRFAVARQTEAELEKAREIAGLRGTGTGRENPDDKRKADFIEKRIEAGDSEGAAAAAWEKFTSARSMNVLGGSSKQEALLRASEWADIPENAGKRVAIRYSQTDPKSGDVTEISETITPVPASVLAKRRKEIEAEQKAKSAKLEAERSERAKQRKERVGEAMKKLPKVPYGF